MESVICILFTLLSLTHFSEAMVDLTFCHNIKFKEATDNCTDGGKYPILGNCTHYFKCDGLASGLLLHEAFTDCPQEQFYDHKTSNCIQASPADIEGCDQKKCESFLKAEGPEKFEDGRGEKYTQGQGPPPQYPPNTGYPQSPQGGQPGYANSGDGHYVQPGQHPGHNDPQQPPYVPAGGAGRADQGKQRQDDKNKHDKNAHQHAGSGILEPMIISMLCAIFLTSAV